MLTYGNKSIFVHFRVKTLKYNLDISFFDSLDGKISYSKLVKNQPTLFQELNNVGYDFQKSKRDNGFYFIKDDNGKS